MPCQWEGNNILILDLYLIEPPYNTVRLTNTNADPSSLKRIERMVSNLNYIL